MVVVQYQPLDGVSAETAGRIYLTLQKEMARAAAFNVGPAAAVEAMRQGVMFALNAAESLGVCVALGEDEVVVDRARFERLRELAAALDDLGYIDFDLWPDQWDNEIDRLTRAREAIERSDFDPLS